MRRISKSAATFSYYKGDPYTLVLDVTDLTNPAAENRLTLTNLASRSRLGLKPAEGNLVVQRLTVRTKPGQSPMMLAAAEHARPSSTRASRRRGPPSIAGNSLPGGGFTITVGQRQWDFASAFSYPNAGLNRLLPSAQPDAGGQAGWSPRVRPRDDGGEVLAEGPDYRLHRTVRFTPRKSRLPIG